MPVRSHCGTKQTVGTEMEIESLATTWNGGNAFLVFQVTTQDILSIKIFLYKKYIYILISSRGHQSSLPTVLHYIYILNVFFTYFWREGKGGREGEKHQCVVACHVPPTGDLAHNPGMCSDLESIW